MKYVLLDKNKYKRRKLRRVVYLKNRRVNHFINDNY